MTPHKFLSLALGTALALGLALAPLPAAHAVTTTAKKSFIAGLVTGAQSAQQTWDVPASVLIAEAIEASDWGTSTLATSVKNYYNAPCSATFTPAQFGAKARAQIGKAYILGAEAAVTNDNPSAFDCSELVEWLFAKADSKITDLAAAQYDATKAVSTSSPHVGDLVFLRNNPARSNGIGHVAVLTKKLSSGDWEIVEARGHAYGVVKTTLSYWKARKYWAGLRRYAKLNLVGEQGVAALSILNTNQSRCYTLNGKKYSKYASAAASVMDRASRIGLGTAYAGARAVVADTDAFIDALAKVDRPATATTYAATLKSLISTYQLSNYDVAPLSLVLKSGNSGSKVTALQYLLKASGATLTATGTYNAATVAAVKAFQSDNSLTADGQAGPITISALLQTVTSGTTGNLASAVNALLAGAQYDTTSGATYGTTSVASVKSLQTKVGVTATGVVDAVAWAKLFMHVAPGTVSISGTPTYGNTLTAVTSGWEPSSVTFAYKWLRGGTSISGATKKTYTVTAADKGQRVSVKVTGSKSAYLSASLTSAATSAATVNTLATTAKPVISGTAAVGRTLTVTAGTWTPTPVSLSYQWYRGKTAISGATATSYKVRIADVGSHLSVQVTGSRSTYVPVTRSSTRTAVVPQLHLTKIGTPRIKGAAKVGTRLRAQKGIWGPGTVTFSYRWYRSGKAISGATASTYKVAKRDSRKTITVRVTATKTGYMTVRRTAGVKIR